MDDARLRAELKSRGKADIAEALRDASLCPVEDDVIFTMQPQPLGLGHAVLCARDNVLPGPVAVILPDDLILGAPCLPEMVAGYQGGRMVATMQVDRDEVRNTASFRSRAARALRSMRMAWSKNPPADAIARGATDLGLSGLCFSGERFDCESKAGMLRATLYLAAKERDCAEVLDELRGPSAPPRAA